MSSEPGSIRRLASPQPFVCWLPSVLSASMTVLDVSESDIVYRIVW
jgi:hypothetical protein